MNDDSWSINEELDRIREKVPSPDEEHKAKDLFEKNRRRDPFPDIPPSVLNAAQFCEYIAETGMIHPFYPEEELIKVATYDIKIGGRYLLWDNEGNKKSEVIEKREAFTLPENSIGYVTLDPFFRIPDYIVARFNLKIKHVYKGLLLGTGPIVDPGFQGKLSIPLHNLTTNDYTFRGGDPLISMEFTKIPYESYVEKGESKVESNLYIPFDKDEEKVGRDVRDYVARAASSRKIRSSIPKVFSDAKETIEKVNSRSFWTFLASVITVGIGLATIAGVLFDVGQSAVDSYIDEYDSVFKQKVESIERNESRIDSLQKKIEKLEDGK